MSIEPRLNRVVLGGNASINQRVLLGLEGSLGDLHHSNQHSASLSMHFPLEDFTSVQTRPKTDSLTLGPSERPLNPLELTFKEKRGGVLR